MPDWLIISFSLLSGTSTNFSQLNFCEEWFLFPTATLCRFLLLGSSKQSEHFLDEQFTDSLNVPNLTTNLTLVSQPDAVMCVVGTMHATAYNGHRWGRNVGDYSGSGMTVSPIDQCYFPHPPCIPMYTLKFLSDFPVIVEHSRASLNASPSSTLSSFVDDD